MVNTSDMSTPVTRGELREELGFVRQEFREELGLVRQEFRHDLQELRAELCGTMATTAMLATLATKQELRAESDRLMNNMGLLARELTDRMDVQMAAMRKEIQMDLARHANALYESMATLIKGSQETYADLPGRVTRLEAAVFPDEGRGGRKGRGRT